MNFELIFFKIFINVNEFSMDYLFSLVFNCSGGEISVYIVSFIFAYYNTF